MSTLKTFQITGDNCIPLASSLINNLADGFENGLLPNYWEEIVGGEIDVGCGSLLPWAHGKNLYFNGCGARFVRSTEIDTTRARFNDC